MRNSSLICFFALEVVDRGYAQKFAHLLLLGFFALEVINRGYAQKFAHLLLLQRFRFGCPVLPP